MWGGTSERLSRMAFCHCVCDWVSVYTDLHTFHRLVCVLLCPGASQLAILLFLCRSFIVSFLFLINWPQSHWRPLLFSGFSLCWEPEAFTLDAHTVDVYQCDWMISESVCLSVVLSIVLSIILSIILSFCLSVCCVFIVLLLVCLIILYNVLCIYRSIILVFYI